MNALEINASRSQERFGDVGVGDDLVPDCQRAAGVHVFQEIRRRQEVCDFCVHQDEVGHVCFMSPVTR